MKLGQLTWIAILSTLLSNAGYATLDVEKKFDAETARQVLIALAKASPLNDNTRPLLKALLNGDIDMDQLNQSDLNQLNVEILDVSKKMSVASGSII